MYHHAKFEVLKKFVQGDINMNIDINYGSFYVLHLSCLLWNRIHVARLLKCIGTEGIKVPMFITWFKSPNFLRHACKVIQQQYVRSSMLYRCIQKITRTNSDESSASSSMNLIFWGNIHEPLRIISEPLNMSTSKHKFATSPLCSQNSSSSACCCKCKHLNLQRLLWSRQSSALAS